MTSVGKARVGPPYGADRVLSLATARCLAQTVHARAERHNAFHPQPLDQPGRRTKTVCLVPLVDFAQPAYETVSYSEVLTLPYASWGKSTKGTKHTALLPLAITELLQPIPADAFDEAVGNDTQVANHLALIRAEPLSQTFSVDAAAIASTASRASRNSG
jgi:hypothetical protein